MEKNNGLTQDQFIAQVDSIVSDKYGIGVYDALGDFNSWDLWDAGLTPIEAASELEGDIDDAIGDMETMGDLLGLGV